MRIQKKYHLSFFFICLLILGGGHAHSLSKNSTSTPLDPYALTTESGCDLEDPSILLDTGKNLKEIEQFAAIEGQCTTYKKLLKKSKKDPAILVSQDFKKSRVLCGKWRFFNLGMRSGVGIPKFLLEGLQEYPEVGHRLSKLGFLDDESWSKEPFAFGLVPVKNRSPISIRGLFAGPLVQISCAGCHVGRLPDGRVSVGGANHDLHYGKFNTYALFSIWLADKRKDDPKRWAPEIQAFYQKLLQDQKLPKKLNRVALAAAAPFNRFILKHLIREDPSSLTTQQSFLDSEPGVFNGFAPILNFTDRELHISIPQLWEIGREDPVHFGSLAGMEKLDDFIGEALVLTTQMKKYAKPEIIEPIREYMKCLKTPENPKAHDLTDSDQGREIFERNCKTCHDLKDGSSSRAFDFAQMGAPIAFKNLFEGYTPPDQQSGRTFRILKKLGLNQFMASQIRARRLNGIWTRKLLGANGSIRDLDHLFCLKGAARTHTDSKDPKNDGTHLDLCEDYSDSEKHALKNYLMQF